MASPDRHAHHDHSHGGAGALGYALVLTLLFAAVELLGGLWSGSLALISDAGHMLSDSAALGIAALAARVARRPASKRHSYGMVRAEVIAAFINGVIMLALVALIAIEAVSRLLQPQAVAGGGVMVIAAIGLAVNIVVALIVSRGDRNLNTRAALLHVIGDMIGSVAALVAGAVIYFTGWLPIDPLLSVLISGLILISTVRLLREALHVLMEGVPAGLQMDSVGAAIASVPSVRRVHDLHIWNISSGQIALSAHLELDDLADWPRLLDSLRIMLREQFDIEHVTLQPEIPGWLKQPYKAEVRIFPGR
ncbi:MAG: cation diffusion facilitator family transporter [Burkholderiales bacterium]|nr:cation transporter [Burkholderiales bacterium]MDQ3195439.1 cation diffusion facilitator family transporter [Pseudomonadota bacterium]